MGLFFLLFFIGLPAAEIWSIAKVGSIIGFWNTLLLLIASVFLGTYMAQIQGQSVLRKVQQCISEGRAPAVEMLDGILVFLGGVLFIIPGFITDGIGLLLIFPPTRWLIRWRLSKGVMTGFSARQASDHVRPGDRGRDSNQPVQRIPKEDKDGRRSAVDAEIVE